MHISTSIALTHNESNHLQTSKCFDKGCVWYMGSTTQINQGATSIYCYCLVCRQVFDDFNLIKSIEKKKKKKKKNKKYKIKKKK